MSLGFDNAPFSLVVLSLVGLIGMFKSSSGYGVVRGIDINTIYNGDIWRFLTANLYFSSAPQFVVGIFLIYTFRNFERQMGTKKFAAFMTIAFVATSISNVAILSTFASMRLGLSISPGPYFFIYSLIPFYHKLVPKLNATAHSILKISFSEKSLIYLFGLQLLISDGLESFVAGLSGLIIGYLYLNNILDFQRFRLPQFIENSFSRFGLLTTFLPFSGVQNRQPVVNTNTNRTRYEAQAFDQSLRANRPTEESIEALMNLGFDRQRAIDALIMSGNNVNMAANNLFSGR